MLIEPADWMYFTGRAAMLAVAMIAFAVAFGRWRRAGARDMQRLFVELDASRSQAREMTELTQQLTDKLAQLESRLEDRLTLAAASAGNVQRGYELALQMARNGSSQDEIVSASGVTRHEAMLVARLHNPPHN